MGYFGRVLRLNAIPPSMSVLSDLMRPYSNGPFARNDGPSARAVAIAAMAGCSLATLIRCHTCIPFAGAVFPMRGGEWDGDSHLARTLRWDALRYDWRVCAFCPECVSEDLGFWGYSYWRRSHQVAGIVGCQKHARGLYVSHQRCAWASQPDEVAAQAVPVPDDVVEHAMGHPVLRRYAEVCSALLERTRPFSTLQRVRALCACAAALGVEPDPDGSRLQFSDLVTERLRGPWLSLQFRGIEGKPHGAYWPPLDDAIYRISVAHSAQGDALAIALLYESIEDAFADLELPLPTLDFVAERIDAPAVHDPPGARCFTITRDAERRERLRRAVRRAFANESLTLPGLAVRERCSTSRLEAIVRAVLKGAMSQTTLAAA